MRTTIRINDHLLSEAKKLALESNMSLTALIETALKETMYRRRQPRSKKRVPFVTFKGRGLKHGVDLDDSAALLDLMGSG